MCVRVFVRVCVRVCVFDNMRAEQAKQSAPVGAAADDKESLGVCVFCV